MFANMFFFGKVSFVDLSGFRETDSFVAPQVLFHNGSLLHSKVQYTNVDYN
jgi:hypothetical protein